MIREWLSSRDLVILSHGCGDHGDGSMENSKMYGLPSMVWNVNFLERHELYAPKTQMFAKTNWVLTIILYPLQLFAFASVSIERKKKVCWWIYVHMCYSYEK